MSTLETIAIDFVAVMVTNRLHAAKRYASMLAAGWTEPSPHTYESFISLLAELAR